MENRKSIIEYVSSNCFVISYDQARTGESQCLYVMHAFKRDLEAWNKVSPLANLSYLGSYAGMSVRTAGKRIKEHLTNKRESKKMSILMDDPSTFWICEVIGWNIPKDYLHDAEKYFIKRYSNIFTLNTIVEDVHYNSEYLVKWESFVPERYELPPIEVLRRRFSEGSTSFGF